MPLIEGAPGQWPEHYIRICSLISARSVRTTCLRYDAEDGEGDSGPRGQHLTAVSIGRPRGPHPLVVLTPEPREVLPCQRLQVVAYQRGDGALVERGRALVSIMDTVLAKIGLRKLSPSLGMEPPGMFMLLKSSYPVQRPAGAGLVDVVYVLPVLASVRRTLGAAQGVGDGGPEHLQLAVRGVHAPRNRCGRERPLVCTTVSAIQTITL